MTAAEAEVTTVHAPGAEVTAYASPRGMAEEYRSRIVMGAGDAKALDNQLRACTLAVLRENTDYGVIPGTGDRKVLYKPGAEKLLQWFGFAFTCDRQEVDLDDDGRKEGVTYRCTITKQLPDGRIVAVATCEGYAGYDEDKFYQTAEQAQFKAEAKERYWAEHDRRPANPNKWKHLTEYRAPWNTIIKMAQKRAIVGATIDATAAAGLFAQEDDAPPVAGSEEPASAAPPPEEDGWPQGAAPRQAADSRPWYDRALDAASAFKTEAEGQKLWRDTAAKTLAGECTPKQQTHIQNRITTRITARRNEAAAAILRQLPEDDTWRARILSELLGEDDARTAIGELEELSGTGLIDVDRARLLARAVIARFPKAALQGRGDRAAPSDKTAEHEPAAGTTEDEPGSVSEDQLKQLHTILAGLGFAGEDREAKLVTAEVITGRAPLTGPVRGRSSRNLSYAEAAKLIAKLDEFTDENGERDRGALIAWMAARESGEAA